MKKFLSCLALLCAGAFAWGAHPELYISEKTLPQVREKIRTAPWAAKAFARIRGEVEPYLRKVEKEPDWLTSRMAMYWKDGERYTQCYLNKKQNWERGEGNAPVPTVRLPGMRTWNNYKLAPLELREPYNETGDMLGIDRRNPDLPPVKVPYKQSGHMVRYNNVEILQIAEKGAFLYYVTKDERYAKLASDVFWTWLFGTYYMNPVLDPERSTGGPGGYEPGGILGYYDYEQIHDDLQRHAAAVYDLAFDYLKKNPHPHLKVLGKSLEETAGIVFKRFLDIGFVRGGKSGNWNINGWGVMFPSMIVLESNDFYPDGKGREHYLRYFTDVTTPYHNALPDILTQYDPVTGLWPESPGYALGTVNSLMDFATILHPLGIDLLAKNPILRKAADATLIWQDERGNHLVFGDARGGPVDLDVFERLLTYSERVGDTEGALRCAAALKALNGDRSRADWRALSTMVAEFPDAEPPPRPRIAYSPFHRHLLLANPSKEGFGLMATLYGGRKGWHLNRTGLAWQFYADGYAVAPDAAAYESYWSKDYGYHQGPTGVNTMLPGYLSGPIVLNGSEPRVAPDEFAVAEGVCPFVTYADVTASEKRRVVALIRSGEKAGYYVDVFRSRQNESDYLQHVIGSLASTSVKLTPVDAIKPAWNPNYSYFKNIRKGRTDADIRAEWSVSPRIRVRMWMAGSPESTLFAMEAPPSTFVKQSVPEKASLSPAPTPAIIVRRCVDAWKTPYVAVFSADGVERRFTKLISEKAEAAGAKIATPSLNGRTEIVLSCAGDDGFSPEKGVHAEGGFSVICFDADGLLYLFLGNGERVSWNGHSLQTAGEWTNATLCRKNGEYFYSADGPVWIELPGKEKREYPAGRMQKI